MFINHKCSHGIPFAYTCPSCFNEAMAKTSAYNSLAKKPSKKAKIKLEPKTLA